MNQLLFQGTVHSELINHFIFTLGPIDKQQIPLHWVIVG